MRPYRCNNTVKSLLEKRIDGLNTGAGLYLNAHIFYTFYLFIEHCPRKAVFRNAATQHTARKRQRFKYRNVMSLQSKIIRCRQSRRTGADEGYLLICCG